MALFKRWLGTADWRRIGVVVLSLVGLVMVVQALIWLRPRRLSGSPAQLALAAAGSAPRQARSWRACR
ncbi:hypothetical protein ULF88_19845 [Halopseudomonas pachastrellae]|nr:hypothetical protein [Halopseudomonas pachastrellae]